MLPSSMPHRPLQVLDQLHQSKSIDQSALVIGKGLRVLLASRFEDRSTDCGGCHPTGEIVLPSYRVDRGVDRIVHQGYESGQILIQWFAVYNLECY